MKDAAIYRSFDNDDYESVVKLIIDTWDYYSWVPAPAVKAMAEYYLNELLSESDEVWVAQIDGSVAGILAAGDRRHRSYKLIWRARKMLTQLEIELGRVGVREFHEFVQTQELDVALLDQAGQGFDAELTLLITDAKWRGHGVGGELFSRFEDWLRAGGMERFYLFTDSSCDFDFYERRGMKRLAQQTFLWQDEGGVPRIPEEYYLYAGETAK